MGSGWLRLTAMRRYSPYLRTYANQPGMSAPGLAGLALLVAAMPVVGWAVTEPAIAGLLAVAAVAGLWRRLVR